MRLGAALVACATLAACARDAVQPVEVPQFVETDATAALRGPEDVRVLPLTTYDGSGESVHPDFLAPPSSWGTRLVYLAVTPYPGGTTKFENPSLYAGVDGVTWGGAPGAPMPLAKPLRGYLSDPDLSYDPASKEIVLYYRQASSVDVIFMMRSADGRTWSTPQAVLSGNFSTVLSPSVVRRGPGDWLMWSVNGAPGCKGASTSVSVRRSMNGVDWTDPEPVTIPLGPKQFVWHLDVQWIDEMQEYWALFPVKTPGTCATTAIYLATSKDGLNWNTQPTPVITAGVIPEFRSVVYRSTFAYNAASDDITFWFSGARAVGKHITWRTAVQRRTRGDLFSAIGTASKLANPSVSAELTSTFDPP